MLLLQGIDNTSYVKDLDYRLSAVTDLSRIAFVAENI